MNVRRNGLILLVATVMLAGCSSPKVSVEEAEAAFAVCFRTVMAATFSGAFGTAPEGVILNDNTLTLEKLDITEFGNIEYTAISGSVVYGNGTMKCDLELIGGPVRTLKFTLSDLSDIGNIKTTIVANGREIEIDVTQDELEAIVG